MALPPHHQNALVAKHPWCGKWAGPTLLETKIPDTFPTCLPCVVMGVYTIKMPDIVSVPLMLWFRHSWGFLKRHLERCLERETHPLRFGKAKESFCPLTTPSISRVFVKTSLKAHRVGPLNLFRANLLHPLIQAHALLQYVNF